MALVIFDCDGVLVESEAILITAELDFLGRHGLLFERDAYIRTYMGMAPREWERKLRAALSAHLGREVETDFFRELGSLTMERFREQLVAVDGARSAVESLTIEKCVASSSSPESLEWKLTHTGLISLFRNSLFSTNLVKNGKPEPDLFRLAAQRMGHVPTSCVVVEDSTNGVIAAKRAGMTAIGFTAASHCPEGHGNLLLSDGADILVESYGELVEAIDLLSIGWE